MILPLLATAARWVVGGWFVLVVAAVAIRAGGGTMAMRGMLRSRRGTRMAISRLQSVVVTMAFAAAYAIAALARDPAAGMPHVPGVLLMILTGSQGTYLWGTYIARNDRGKRTW